MTPSPIGAPILPAPIEVMIGEVGDYANENGAQMILRDNKFIVQAAYQTTEIEFAVPIEIVLEAVGAYNKQTGH